MSREADLRLQAIQKLADFEAAAAIESRSKLIDEHNSAFRWMIASLFALNGGAILGVLTTVVLQQKAEVARLQARLEAPVVRDR